MHTPLSVFFPGPWPRWLKTEVTRREERQGARRTVAARQNFELLAHSPGNDRGVSAARAGGRWWWWGGGGGGGGSEMGREGVVEADVRPITTKQRSPAGLDFVTARFSVAGGSEVPVPACPARALTYDGQSAWAQDGQLCWGLWHLSFGLSGRCADVTLSCSGGCVGRGDVGAQAVVCF